jgi:capsular exopolysaccharide synthesis family protein
MAEHDQLQEATPSVLGLLQVLRRRWLLILACGIVAGGAALALSLNQTKKYSAAASLLFRDPGFDTALAGGVASPVSDPAREAATNLKLITLGTVSFKTAAALHIAPDVVTSDVSVAAQGESNVVSVTATDHSPTLAAKIANAFARQLILFRRDADRSKIEFAESLVQRQIRALTPVARESLEGRTLLDRAEQLRILSTLQTGNAELVQTADVPTSPSSPTPKRDGILGALLGLFVGIVIAFVLARLDRRIKDSTELAATFGLPLLTTVPQARAYSEAAGAVGLSAVETEAFHMLRARLRYFNVDREIATVLVTSAAPGEGKSTVAWHLASTSALTGARVIIVEVDLRRPTIARDRKLLSMPGLAELLSQDLSLDAVVQRKAVGTAVGANAGRSLDVLVAGATPPNPSELIESHKMSELIDVLAEQYDLVVIDTPPTSAVSDAIPLMGQVSGVIVVSRAGMSTRDGAVTLRDQLIQFDAPTLGVVANGVRDRSGGYYGYYGYGPDLNSLRPSKGNQEDVATSARDAESETYADDFSPAAESTREAVLVGDHDPSSSPSNGSTPEGGTKRKRIRRWW